MAKIQSVMWKEKEGWTLERAYLAVKCQVQLCTSHILTDTDRIVKIEWVSVQVRQNGLPPATAQPCILLFGPAVAF